MELSAGAGNVSLLRGPCEVADTEADARAKMLCYLLENKLISPSDIT